MRFVEPVTLTGEHASIEPLGREHEDALARAAADGELWRLWYTTVAPPEKMAEYIATALDMRERLGAMPFVVREKPSGDIVGCTRYFNVDETNRRLEIGHTWYSKRVQRGPINTECKLLLLTHAFETLDLHRVEFKTDALNEQSRKALLRIGAVQEGLFRKHMTTASGRVRDSVYFSILDTEWPGIKARLVRELDRERA